MVKYRAKTMDLSILYGTTSHVGDRWSVIERGQDQTSIRSSSQTWI